jgi:lycopene beta-cyclase
MQDFDIIILGAGAAGLSLAHHLGLAGLGGRVLVIERNQTRVNDRRWSFWESTDGPFETLVSRRWDHIQVFGHGFGQRFDINPNAYKMIRGADFYAHMDAYLERQPNITRVYGDVQRIEDETDGAKVWVDGQPYRGRWVFNSIVWSSTPKPGYHHLLQHFKGYVLETKTPAFDPSVATFMDFRTPQHGDTRFVYVLPTSPTRALVEYTVFSGSLLPDPDYDAGLRAYLNDILKLGDFTILETESGVIPMTDAPFELQPRPHVMNIGTAGGCTKPSTGYTFRHIQAQSARIVESLQQTGQPFYAVPRWERHRWMDSVLLRVLATGREDGSHVFTRLFQTNPVHRVLEFLNENTTLADDIALMSTMNIPVFAASGLEIAASSVRRALSKLSTREMHRSDA